MDEERQDEHDLGRAEADDGNAADKEEDEERVGSQEVDSEEQIPEEKAVIRGIQESGADMAHGSEESDLEVAHEVLKADDSRGLNDLEGQGPAAKGPRWSGQQMLAALVGTALDEQHSRSADGTPSLSPVQASRMPNGSQGHVQLSAQGTKPHHFTQGAMQRAQELLGQQAEVERENKRQEKLHKSSQDEYQLNENTSVEVGFQQLAQAVLKGTSHAHGASRQGEAELGAERSGVVLNTKILESSAPSRKETSQAQFNQNDDDHVQLANPKKQGLKLAQFWSVGGSKPILGNNLHPFPAQKALKTEMIHRQGTETRRQKLLQIDQHILKGRGAIVGSTIVDQNLLPTQSLTKNLQVRKISLYDPSVTFRADDQKPGVTEPMKQDSSSLVGLMNEAENPLAERSSDRFGGSSGTGQQSPKLAATLAPAVRHETERDNTSCRQPISGLLIPAPDFLYNDTPEIQKEIRVSENAPRTMFGVSQHDSVQDRLHSGELYLAQNSSRSHTYTHKTPLEDKQREKFHGASGKDR